ncbi:MAG: serine hydrolase [Xanthomonadales bacterium]|nr:serine hydrolase [Xanthomonadales bacterium]
MAAGTWARLIALTGLLLVSHPAWAQIDSAALTASIQSGNYGSIKSLLVQRGDQRLYERYFRGANASQMHLLNSVTKSVGATLIGVAVRRDQVSIDRPVSDYFPQYAWQSPELNPNRNLRLRDILSMRAGLAWDEWSTSFTDPHNSFVQMTLSPDWYRHVLSLPRAAPPGCGCARQTCCRWGGCCSMAASWRDGESSIANGSGRCSPATATPETPSCFRGRPSPTAMAISGGMPGWSTAADASIRCGTPTAPGASF